ncbi:uncharacterized protein [Chironomus tepperi]|uniref:uncharacterized protein n=1 Tax=Chironomus tepperi TaxID=113505 RepID=UPI00391EF966
MANCDVMGNTKIKQEEEIEERIQFFKEREIFRLNGCNTRTHQESKNVNNYSNYSDGAKRMSNAHANKRPKLSLRIDSITSLSPQKGQRDLNQYESSSGDSSPRPNHHATKVDKEKHRIASPSLKHKLLKNGNDSYPYKRIDSMPVKSFETSRSNCIPSKEATKSIQSPIPNCLGSPKRVYPLLSPTSSPLPYQKQMTPNLRVFKGLDLMCWEADPKRIRTNEKYEIAYRNMTKKYPLIALFKCMGKKCSLYTDYPIKMVNHLTLHDNEMKKQYESIAEKYKTEMKSVYDEHEKNKLKLKESEELMTIYDYYLCCSYCQLREKDPKSLVHHINDIHRKDIYQCGFCFFRSCVKETCLEHWEISHKNKVILIYECQGKEKLQLAKNRVMGRLLEKRKTYVVPLMCKVCEVGYYPLKQFLEHCERDHREENEIRKVEKCLHVLDQAFKAHCYGMYQCLYCMHGCHKEKKMSIHLIQHPSEFGFYCMRQSEDSNNDPNFYQSIESTKILEVQKEVNVIEFNEHPGLLDCKNYKEIIDSDLQKMLL